MRGFSKCAEEDSNLHGPYSPQGTQPRPRLSVALKPHGNRGLRWRRSTIWTDLTGWMLSPCCHAGSRARPASQFPRVEAGVERHNAIRVEQLLAVVEDDLRVPERT
jgi:hypothetical protein